MIGIGISQMDAAAPIERTTRERTTAMLRAMEAELRRHGVAGLGLYGSLARGEATDRSDVDLLLTLAPGARFSLLDLSAVRLLVTDRLGRDAGVVVESDLSPAFRSRIARDLITVY